MSRAAAHRTNFPPSARHAFPPRRRASLSMHSPASHPRLPVWPFLLADVALFAAAGYLAMSSGVTPSWTAVAAIAACVGLGAILLCAPFVANHERTKQIALDDRQRSLEALAATVSAAAEQIGIAATGLHGIADLAHKNLKQADQLPHRMQEKIAEFQAQLATVADTEKEELERELLALRTSESERLDSVSQRVSKLTTEWARLESATRDHLAGLTREIDARIARLESLAASPPVVPAVALAPAPAPLPASPSAPEAAAETAPEAAPKRPRKPRRDPTAATDAPADSPAIAPVAPAASPVPAVRIEEPPPIPAARIVEVTPVAPGTADPFASHLTSTPSADPLAALRKRVAKTDPAPETPSLGLDLGDTGAAGANGGGERTLSSDGATRLIATAYIGIGNRLFIRGEGPGLSWDKGVPLQFVSIGKWRWETNDATVPVRFKLYKNDELECAALGAQSLDPGYQQEVTAGF